MSIRLQREIGRLKKSILSLSALVEESVQRAVAAYLQRDEALACQLAACDDAIDTCELEIEEECQKVLALCQPVAADLRFIVTVLKVNSDLERIGDLAVHIGERAAFLATQPWIGVPAATAGMADSVLSMVKSALDALVNQDPTLARAVCAADDAMDEVHRGMYTWVDGEIQRQPERIQSLISTLTVSRYLERIADHATNIAEEVIYMIEGEIVRHRIEDRLHRQAD
ncbi:MAG: phosphate signaling complex protein PhoU [Candidatus Schekmanbacteria bacterium]|nr:phosphate signaling complex protein PhoU [Candidatus Schekmanbacteria bacterium]